MSATWRLACSGEGAADAGRVAVPESELFVEHGAHVVVKAAVVVAVVPLLSNGVGDFDDLRGFERRQALVGKPEGLVVDVLVQVALGPRNVTTFSLPHTGQVCDP